MSKLIQKRNRIQTIQTIRKVTDAMRIISMSAHSRLKAKQEPLSTYLNYLASLLAKVQQAVPSWKNERLTPTNKHDDNPLIILIGSQKGLCGGFNTFLSKHFSYYLSAHVSERYHYMGIGKKAIDFLEETHPNRLIQIFPILTAHNFLAVAQQVTDYLMTVTPAYTSVIIFSNVFKSFFVQKPTTTLLIPFLPEKLSPSFTPIQEGYLWDEQPSDIINKIAEQYIEAQLQHLMFQSLLSEHAARFISMDNSTRNANTLLETTKLEYNKLRQAKITTEITELTGSF